MQWDFMEIPKHLDTSGGRTLLQDDYGMYDNMTPKSAIATSAGLTVAIYLTNSPTRGGKENREIHLLKLEEAPGDL